jgi:hypothetical protein
MIVQDKCVNEVRRRGLAVRGVHDHLHRAATSELYSACSLFQVLRHWSCGRHFELFLPFEKLAARASGVGGRSLRYGSFSSPYRDTPSREYWVGISRRAAHTVLFQ